MSWKKTLQSVIWGISIATTLSAQEVVFTGAAEIGGTNVLYEGYDVIVSNGVLTIWGAHNFNSLKLTNGATVTHPACTTSETFSVHLTVSGLVHISADSAFNVDGRGYLAGRTVGNTTVGAAQAGCGGSYGGMGGFWAHASNTNRPNAVYGDYRTPAHQGSGGSLLGAGTAVAGGGLVVMECDVLHVDGSIRANGAPNAAADGKAGSGGGVYITADVVSGTGTIRANGGSCSGGGSPSAGGGGRVAVHANTWDGFNPTVQLEATGGQGGHHGAAGTVYFTDGDGSRVLLVNTHGRLHASFTPLGLPDSGDVEADLVRLVGTNRSVGVSTATVFRAYDLFLEDGAILSHQHCTVEQTYKLEVAVSNVLHVGSNSYISVNDRGYLPGRTTGNVTEGGASGNSGGSYGGLGARWTDIGGEPNWTYGDFRSPNDWGSGGAGAGAGGGLARMVADTIELEGAISARGENTSDRGGSGGGVYIETRVLTGSGSISADGGSSAAGHGRSSGGGGRVAIRCVDAESSFDWASQVTVQGGQGGVAGAPGTLYWQDLETGNELLYIGDYGGLSTEWTPLGTNGQQMLQVEHLIVSGTNTRAAPIHDLWLSVSNLSLLNGGRLSHRHASGTQDYRLQVKASGHVYVDEQSFIDGIGRGYLPGRTRGNTKAGAATGNGSGSYGGLGGGLYPNRVYGNAAFPDDPGAGAVAEAAGGGLVFVSARSMTLDGALTVRGGETVNRGGAGGGILVDVETLAGSGVLNACGGSSSGGAGRSGGGGGRVAVYYKELDGFLLDSNQVKVAGGTSDSPGAPGTVSASTNHFLFWSHPRAEILHGECLLEWNSVGLHDADYSVSISVLADGVEYSLGRSLQMFGHLPWDTMEVADGVYELRAEYFMSDQIMGTVSKPVTVNNSVHYPGAAITEHTVWEDGNVYVLDRTLMIHSNVTLTVEPGAIVKAARGAAIYVEGTLLAHGTEGSKVWFTSLADDTIGGDTNLDGDRSVPRPGDWNGILPGAGGVVDMNEHAMLLYATITHAGDVTSDQVWQGGFVHHVVENVFVKSGATVTVEAGAVIKVALGRMIRVEAGGVLNAIGSSAVPITFTSERDDSMGGDIHGDQSSPEPGDWLAIYASGGTVRMNHCRVLYGGGSLTDVWNNSGALRTDGGATLILSNSVVRDAFYDGVLCWNGTARIVSSIIDGADRGVCAHPDGDVTVVNSTLYDNRVGVLVHGGAISLDNTIVAGSLHAGIQYDTMVGSNLRHVRYGNVWSTQGTDYLNTADQTGINGNISADPQFAQADGFNYRLDYLSPCIDAADTTNAPPADFMGAPRVNDPRIVVKGGLPDVGGIYADMGAFEFVEHAESDIDLAPVLLSGPVVATVGDDVDVSWSVRNVGVADAVGPWRDRISLVFSPNFHPQTIPVGTALVGQGLRLAPGETVSFTNRFRVPGGMLQTYQWKVDVNVHRDVFEGRNTTNNALVSAGGVTLALPELSLSQGVSGSFSSAGESLWYAFSPGAGRSVRLSLDIAGDDGRVEVYVGHGYVPTRQQFDVMRSGTGAGQMHLQIPETYAGPIYIMVYVATVPAPASFTLDAAETAFGITSVSPPRVADQGTATLTIRGEGFTEHTLCMLVDSAGVTNTASSVIYDRSGELRATFDMTGVARGACDVRVARGASQSVLPGGLTVILGDPGSLNYAITIPDLVRAGRPAMGLLQFWNVGHSDAFMSTVVLRGEDALIALPGRSFITNALVIRPVARDGYSGFLAPGEHGQMAFEFLPSLDTAGGTLEVIPARADAELDWDTFLERLRPAFMPEDAWTAIGARFRGIVGDTSLEYDYAMAENANYLRELGFGRLSDSDVIGFLMSRAGLFGELAQRYSWGAMGRGSRKPLVDVVFEDSSGSVWIGSSGGATEFRPAGVDLYRSVDGEQSVLAREGVGYMRTDKYGVETRFGANGYPTNVLHPTGFEIVYQYDGDRIVGIQNSSGDAWAYAYHASGVLTQMVDRVGRKTLLEYDPGYEYLLVLSNRFGRFVFENITESSSPARHAKSAVVFPDGNRITLEYDGQGRLSRTYQTGGEYETTYAYADPGRMTVTHANGGISTFYRNHLGKTGSRVSRMNDPVGHDMSFLYDPYGNVTRLTVAGSRTHAAYDSHNNRVSLQDNLGRSLGMSYATPHNTLDTVNTLRGRTVDFEYHDNGLLSSVAFPDGHRVRAAYDATGQMTNWNNARGQDVAFAYNARQLPISISAPDMPSWNIEYDAHLNVITRTSAVHAVTYVYDARDLLVRTDYPSNRWVTYQYNSARRRTNMTFHDGFAVNYDYDPVGRLAEITAGDGQLFVRYTYDSAGRVVRKDKRGGAHAIHGYDLAGRTTSVVNRTVAEEVVSRFFYSYNDHGLADRVETHLGVWSNAYDEAGQLVQAAFVSSTSAVPDQVLVYAYDAGGNWSQVTRNGTQTVFTANGSDQYVNVGGHPLVYDADGNLVAWHRPSGLREYEYNARNALSVMQTPGDAITNVYESGGLLRAFPVNGQRYEALVDYAGGQTICARYNTENGEVERQVFGLGLVCRVGSDGEPVYYNYDMMGNASELTAVDGSVLNRYLYDPFGEKILQEESVQNLHTYGARWDVHDFSDSMYLMRHRHYNSALGRFVSRDPLGLHYPNLYAYAGNNPVQLHDPLGLQWTTVEEWALGDALDQNQQHMQTVADVFMPSENPWVFVAMTALPYVAEELPSALTPVMAPASAMQPAAGGVLYVYNQKNVLDAIFDLPELSGKPPTPIAQPQPGPHYAQPGGNQPQTYPPLIPCPQQMADMDATIQQLMNDPLIQQTINSGQSIDPNDIIGPAGVGARSWVRLDQTLPYMIRFENLTNATLAAQTVSITHVLDAGLDMSTFVLGDFGIGTNVYSVPTGLQTYQTTVDMRQKYDLDVLLEAELNPETRTMVWEFTSLDPDTGLLTRDPIAGFLPPNTNAPQGEGFVMYSIRGDTNNPATTSIEAQASIIFDVNEPIITPRITNAVDRWAPDSAVTAMPDVTPIEEFRVRWSGWDHTDGSGVARYDVYVREDEGAWHWWTNTASTWALFAGEDGSLYDFYSIATDRVGHREDKSPLVEASTLLDLSFYMVDIQPVFGTNYTEHIYTNEIPYEVVTQRIYAVEGQRIQWPSVSGHLYHIDTAVSLVSGDWIGTPWTNLVATPPFNAVTNPVSEQAQTGRIFRVNITWE